MYFDTKYFINHVFDGRQVEGKRWCVMYLPLFKARLRTWFLRWNFPAGSLQSWIWQN